MRKKRQGSGEKERDSANRGAREKERERASGVKKRRLVDWLQHAKMRIKRNTSAHARTVLHEMMTDSA